MSVKVSYISDEIRKRILQDVPEQDLDKEVVSFKTELVYATNEGGLSIESWEYKRKVNPNETEKNQDHH